MLLGQDTCSVWQWLVIDLYDSRTLLVQPLNGCVDVQLCKQAFEISQLLMAASRTAAA
jgi:hypothetical protein